MEQVHILEDNCLTVREESVWGRKFTDMNQSKEGLTSVENCKTIELLLLTLSQVMKGALQYEVHL